MYPASVLSAVCVGFVVLSLSCVVTSSSGSEWHKHEDYTIRGTKLDVNAQIVRQLGEVSGTTCVHFSKVSESVVIY